MAHFGESKISNNINILGLVLQEYDGSMKMNQVDENIFSSV